MKLKIAGICLVALLSLTFGGCLNSEGEYQRLTEERDALSAELSAAQKENEILKKALSNIETEKERLMAALKPYEAPPKEPQGAEARPGQPQGAADAGENRAGGGVHIARRGDTLSNIAARYNTTMNELLALNPYLARRNSYMVWENDNILLPAAPAPLFQ